MPMLKDAAYSWWVHPLAVGDGDLTWLGWVDRHGGNGIDRVNHQTGTVDRVLLAGPSSADEHNGVALALDPNQSELIAFYSRHGNDHHIRYQVVDRDTLEAGSQQTLDFGAGVTYAQVLQVPGTATIHVLCRAGGPSIGGPFWKYRTSDDWGATWGPAKTLIDPNGIGQNYLQARPWPDGGATVHLAHYGHPEGSSYRNVGYAQLDLTTGQIRKVDGTLLGDLDAAGGPQITPQQLDVAIAPSSSHRVRLLDVGTVQTQPAIAYAVWNISDPGEPATYKIKRLVGGAWSSETWSLPAGDVMGFSLETHYHGGMALGANGKLWTSREDGGEWVIEAWQRSGSTYLLQGELARTDSWSTRPYPVRNPGAVEVVWQNGVWHHYRVYYMDMVVS